MYAAAQREVRNRLEELRYGRGPVYGTQPTIFSSLLLSGSKLDALLQLPTQLALLAESVDVDESYRKSARRAKVGVSHLSNFNMGAVLTT